MGCHDIQMRFLLKIESLMPLAITSSVDDNLPYELICEHDGIAQPTEQLFEDFFSAWSSHPVFYNGLVDSWGFPEASVGSAWLPQGPGLLSSAHCGPSLLTYCVQPTAARTRPASLLYLRAHLIYWDDDRWTDCTLWWGWMPELQRGMIPNWEITENNEN